MPVHYTWLKERKEVPVLKKGNIPEVEDLEEMEEEDIASLMTNLEEKGMILIPAEELDDNFERDLKNDIDLLKQIKEDWSDRNRNQDDPKLDLFVSKIDELLAENKDRKIVVFTEFSDTADYLNQKFKENKFKRVFKYSSSDSSRENKNTIKVNFDAGLQSSEQKNDFDVLVATDAISEGFNLHRAGVIINYDIPYNPTRVIQRVGRINRINKKVFDTLFILNFFPTVTGEEEVKTRAIASLKMNLIHSLMGEDTRYLSKDEELKSYFVKQFEEENSKFESRSWDAPHRNEWLNFLNDAELVEQVQKIPHRTRIARNRKEEEGIIAFGKRGYNYIFAKGKNEIDIDFVSPEFALGMFKAGEEEESVNTTINFDSVYQRVKQHIFKDNTSPTMGSKSRRYDASTRLGMLADLYPAGKEWCDDVITIIKDFDALPEGLLKDLSSIDFNKENPKEVLNKYRILIPDNYVAGIFKMAEKAKSNDELIVLSEQFI